MKLGLVAIIQREHVMEITLGRLVELGHAVVASADAQEIADEGVQISRTVENHGLLAVVHERLQVKRGYHWSDVQVKNSIDSLHGLRFESSSNGAGEL
jgi:hypothetical protein